MGGRTYNDYNRNMVGSCGGEKRRVPGAESGEDVWIGEG